MLNGLPAAENLDPLSLSPSNEPRKSQARQTCSLIEAQGSQQVSLLTPRRSPGTAGSVRAFAGVAQLVEHLFCKQVVSGSIPLASSTSCRETFSTLFSSISFSSSFPSFWSEPLLTKTSEGCPSGQREQAVNLPAHAYVGSNPTPSTINRARTARGPLLRPQALLGDAAGMRSPRRGLRPSRNPAGVTQLVESQFSKLKVDGSSPFSRSNFSGASCTELVDTARVTRTNTAHLAQLVEHVLGKDEVISSNLMVGSNLQP